MDVATLFGKSRGTEGNFGGIRDVRHRTFGLWGSDYLNGQGTNQYVPFEIDPMQVQSDIDAGYSWGAPYGDPYGQPHIPPMGMGNVLTPYSIFNAGPYNPFDWGSLIGGGK